MATCSLMSRMTRDGAERVILQALRFFRGLFQQLALLEDLEREIGDRLVDLLHRGRTLSIASWTKRISVFLSLLMVHLPGRRPSKQCTGRAALARRRREGRMARGWRAQSPCVAHLGNDRA